MLRALTLPVLVAGCASLAGSTPIPNTQALAGTWHGRVSGLAGHSVAMMTVAETGAYAGTMYLDAVDKEFRGSIIVIDAARVRYQGTLGNGTVRLEERDGQPILRFVQDGGGGGATFTRR